jgi:hypothetical protein
MFPERMVDKIPENLCFKTSYPVTQKDKNVHVVVQTLPFNSFVSISVIVCTFFLPKKMTLENATKIGFYFLRTAVEKHRDFIFAYP